MDEQVKHTVLLIENHTIVREGIRRLLDNDPALEVVAEADDGAEGLKAFNELRPDTVLVDLGLPRISGIDVIKQLRQISKEAKILILTAHNSDEYLRAAFKAGASGYLLKDCCHQELLNAIQTVHDNLTYICPGMSGLLVEGYLNGNSTTDVRTLWDLLTTRERQVLKLIAEGYRNKDIGKVLFISCKTVEKHRANLMKKLDLHSVSELTGYYLSSCPAHTDDITISTVSPRRQDVNIAQQ